MTTQGWYCERLARLLLRSFPGGAEGKETYVYRPDAANAAIRLAGLELGLFTEKAQVAHDVHDMTEEEVLEAIVKDGQELLAQRRSDKAKVINRDS